MAGKRPHYACRQQFGHRAWQAAAPTSHALSGCFLLLAKITPKSVDPGRQIH